MTALADTTMSNPLAVAGAGYIMHGPVIPIERGGKRPAPGACWKGDAAPRSAADLRPYLNKNLNVGMRLDNYLVVDVDGEEGLRSLEALEAEIGALPRIVVQHSGGGGLHIFFRLAGAESINISTKLSSYPKIDFKAGPGHLLVMAPSLHASGGRYVLKGNLGGAPPIPAALLDLLAKRQPPSSRAQGDAQGQEGERHTLLLQHGVRLLNQGWGLESIREGLWQHTTTFRDPWTNEEAQCEIDGVLNWLGGLERGQLFPKSATPMDVAEWLKPHLREGLVHLDNGDWLVKRDAVFVYARREQLKSLFVRTLQPALKDFERWLSFLDSEESRDQAQRKLDRLKTLSWTDKAIEALAADPDLCIRASELDPPGVLNFKNGPFTLDGAPAPTAICTKQLGVNFNPDATSSPGFDAFLDWALSPASGATLMDIVGHALQRQRNSQFLWLCEGGQAAGKSTLLDTFAELLGSYAVAPDTALLFDKNMRGGGANEDLFALRGAAWAAFPEGPEGVPLCPTRCKTLTGGDKLSARPLYGHLVQFENKAELVLVTNHQTRLNVDDGGLRRRVKRIHFKNHAAEDGRDLHLKQKLLQEGEAIMNRLLAHALLVQDRGIVISEEIEEDTAAFFERQDIMQQYIDERLLFTPEARSSGSALYTAYQFWCTENGIPPRSRAKFYGTFEEKVPTVRAYIRDGAKAYSGVRVR